MYSCSNSTIFYSSNNVSENNIATENLSLARYSFDINYFLQGIEVRENL